MAVNNIIKRIQNIMRQDAGINGDAQRIEQMTWMFFLKGTLIDFISIFFKHFHTRNIKCMPLLNSTFQLFNSLLICRSN